MKLLYFDHYSSASEYYRLLPLDYIKSPDFTITRSTEKNITFATINDYDVIIFLRPSSQAHLNAINLCKDQHKKIIGDFDDDCLHVPPTNPMYGTYEAEKQSTIRCIALCDEVWVATESIKRSFRLYNKNIHIIPNSHNDTIFPVNKKKPFTFNKVAMWRGGGSHIADIYATGVAEGIVDLINDNPLWIFYWLGQRFEFIEYRLKNPNFFYNEGASTIQFYKMMHGFQPCMFFYPLETTTFNQSKSNCSFLESVYSGAAYFGNTALPEMQKPGITDLKELLGLMKLPDNKLEKILKKNHEASWKYIQEHLLLSKINLTRMERLLKFVK
jgi:hypothetical protein